MGVRCYSADVLPPVGWKVYLNILAVFDTEDFKCDTLMVPELLYVYLAKHFLPCSHGNDVCLRLPCCQDQLRFSYFLVNDLTFSCAYGAQLALP